MSFTDNDSDSSLRSAIVHAYSIIQGTMGTPFPIANTLAPVDADTTLTLASGRLATNDLIMEMVDGLLKQLHVDYRANEQPQPPLTSTQLSERLAQTSDLYMAKDYHNAKVQVDAMRSMTPVLLLRDLLARDSHLHKVILSKLQHPDKET
ncbi:hypothetical protein IL306_013578 [Fusarium sp. DS 682]|nr:hypothetical protein IL306_013578 [Fusarium sp. DS 682]